MAASFAAASPSTMLAGRAALKKAGRAAVQGPANTSGTGAGPAAPQPQPAVGTLGVAALARPGVQRGMMPKLSPMQVLSKPQQGQVQAQGKAPTPQDLVNKAKAGAQGVVNQVTGQLAGGGSGQTNGAGGGQTGTAGGPNPITQVQQFGTTTMDHIKDTVDGVQDTAAGAADPMAWLKQLLGGGGNFNIMEILQRMGFLPGGGGPSLFSGGGGGEGGQRANGGAGSNPSGPSTPAAAVSGLPRNSPMGVLAQRGVQPGMATPPPGQVQNNSTMGVAAGAGMPTGGLQKHNPAGTVQSQQGAQQGQGAAGAYQTGAQQASTSSNGGWTNTAGGGSGSNSSVNDNWSKGTTPDGYHETYLTDPLSQAAQTMTDTDMGRYRQNFNPFNTTNADANNALGATVNDYMNSAQLGQQAEDAARGDLRAGIDRETEAAMRDLASRQSRGGVVGTGATTGIYNSAMQAQQAGERGLAQDSFGREMGRLGGLGNARNNLASSLTGGNQMDMENLMAQFTSNKELGSQLLAMFPELLDALSPG